MPLKKRTIKKENKKNRQKKRTKTKTKQKKRNVRVPPKYKSKKKSMKRKRTLKKKIRGGGNGDKDMPPTFWTKYGNPTKVWGTPSILLKEVKAFQITKRLFQKWIG